MTSRADRARSPPPTLRTRPRLGSRTLARSFATDPVVDWFVRTHWNVGVLYYRDKDRTSKATSKTWLAQLQIYL